MKNASLLLLAALLAAGAGERDMIVGGADADAGSYPFAAALVALEAESGEVTYWTQYCGGSLVKDAWVLTAAHCVDGTDLSGGGLHVVTGLQDLSDAVDAEDARLVVVDAVYQHPDFDDESLQNDVALLHLAEAVPFAVVALANASSSWLTVVGWGDTEADDDDGGVCDCPDDYECNEECNTLECLLDWGDCASLVTDPLDVFIPSGAAALQEVLVPFVSPDDCDDAYPGEIDASMLCAGATGQDSCQGDSGGPLLNADGAQVGIVSWGVGCADAGYPGVYASVPHLREWIDSYVAASFLLSVDALDLYMVGDGPALPVTLEVRATANETVALSVGGGGGLFELSAASLDLVAGETAEVTVTFVGPPGNDSSSAVLTVGGQVDVPLTLYWAAASHTLAGLEWAHDGGNWTANADGSVSPTEAVSCLFAVAAEPTALTLAWSASDAVFLFWATATETLASFPSGGSGSGEVQHLVPEPAVVYVCAAGGHLCGSSLNVSQSCAAENATCLCRGHEVADDVCHCDAGFSGDRCQTSEIACVDGVLHALHPASAQGTLSVSVEEYANDLVCGWAFDQAVTLTVEAFDLESGFDFLSVGDSFDGTGSLTPGYQLCVPAGENITFSTDASVVADGFELSWEVRSDACPASPPVVACDASVVLLNETTTIRTDEYRAEQQCGFVVNGSAVLSFSWFDVEQGFDFVTVMDGDVLLAQRSGSGVDECFYAENALKVLFQTDELVQTAGFEAVVTPVASIGDAEALCPQRRRPCYTSQAAVVVPDVCDAHCAYTFAPSDGERVRVAATGNAEDLVVSATPYALSPPHLDDDDDDDDGSVIGPLYLTYEPTAYGRDLELAFAAESVTDLAVVVVGSDYQEGCALAQDAVTDEWGAAVVASAGVEAQEGCLDRSTGLAPAFALRPSRGSVLSPLTTLLASGSVDEFLLLAAYPDLAHCLRHGGVRFCDLVWANSASAARNDWQAAPFPSSFESVGELEALEAATSLHVLLTLGAALGLESETQAALLSASAAASGSEASIVLEVAGADADVAEVVGAAAARLALLAVGADLYSAALVAYVSGSDVAPLCADVAAGTLSVAAFSALTTEEALDAAMASAETHVVDRFAVDGDGGAGDDDGGGGSLTWLVALLACVGVLALLALHAYVKDRRASKADAEPTEYEIQQGQAALERQRAKVRVAAAT